ncbi:MAG TPA: class I SAM-dependent methyltransferase [Clostridiales bacterium]|nr:class I SAM-dependent methyltransferase [Clostridiales bacterium]HQP69647.1 class I SAM-dependent methyltransferase [Clostridiales bacterium]
MRIPDIINTYDHPLINRIVKNYKHFKKQAKKTESDCFRVYDRDIPEFQFSIDHYAGKFLVQYYSNDESEDVPTALKEIIETGLSTIFGIKINEVFWKVRKKRALLEQYEKLSDSRDFFTVRENGISFYINLKDYLDSGLFLDHRPAREFIAKQASGKAVLNLYSYTASFSLYCAKAGSSGTVSVDMSNTYSDWARENMILNGFDLAQNKIIREDCSKYLRQASERKERYDIIIIDPPTISRSKKMEEMFDVNRDHPDLILSASKLLRGNESIIMFSTNSRKFKMDEELNGKFIIEDISHKTIPDGFRDKKIHKVYILKLK